jgi:hypothetical protein
MPRVNPERREAHHLRPSSTEVKNGTAFPYVIMAWFLIKHRENFYFLPFVRSVFKVQNYELKHTMLHSP